MLCKQKDVNGKKGIFFYLIYSPGVHTNKESFLKAMAI